VRRTAPRTPVARADAGGVLMVTAYATVGVRCRFAFLSSTITG
jgi:hypothetical protein